MRVLILTTDAYGGHGGIALYNRDIVAALCAMPDVSEVVVLPRTIQMALEEIPAKVRFVEKAAGSKLRYLRNALGESFADYDLVVCGHINLLPVAALVSSATRSPLVLMVYGIDVWAKPYRSARTWLRSIDAVWTISSITQERMNAWAGLQSRKYHLLPNAIHLDKYGSGPKRTDLVERYDIKGCRVIMTLARLPSADRCKGVDEVLEVMPMLLRRDATLKYIVVGDGKDRDRLEKKAQQLGLATHVVFTGLIKEADKADHFRLADAFVMPGRGEGFGFVFLEALACGIPVVGSLVDGSREALRDGLLGELVDPADPASITEGVLRALTNARDVPEGLNYFAWPAFSRRVAEAVSSVAGLRP